MADAKTRDLQKQYDLIYDNISKKLEQQLDSLSSLDTKSSILLATIGVIFAGYLQLMSSDRFNFGNFKFLVIAELLLFLFAGFFVFRAFILNNKEKWYNDPRPSKLLRVFSQNSDKGLYWLKDEINNSINEAYEKNDILVKKKYNFLLIARMFLYGGIILLFLHIIFLLFGVNKIIIPLA